MPAAARHSRFYDSEQTQTEPLLLRLLQIAVSNLSSCGFLWPQLQRWRQRSRLEPEPGTEEEGAEEEESLLPGFD